ncbi:hypothetical protein [Gracilimonas sp.]|uniref:hypothetical protein n=1 Tax=Gracilimonas sp. TaxID=1974203 RepID=UPI003BA92110
MKSLKNITGIWFLIILVSVGSANVAAAQNCQETACARFSTRSPIITDTELYLTNLLFSAQLGVNVLFTKTQLQAIADAQIDLNDLAIELMVSTSAASVTELESKSISLGAFLDAAIAVTVDASAVQALQLLKSQASTNTSTFVVGDLLEISLLNLSLSNGFISLSDILEGAISHLFYSDNISSTPIFVSLDGSILGLGIANQVDVYLIVTEPATIACGDAGAVFTSASTRLKLIIDLVDLDKTAALQSLLTTMGISLDAAVSNLQLSITQLELYVDVSRAEGQIISVDGINDEVVVQATPSLADIYLGDIDDNLFFSNAQINPLTDLDFANVGTLGFDVLGTPVTAGVEIKSYAKDVTGVNTETLTFTGPFAETQTIGDNRGYILSLIEALVTNVELEVRLVLDPSVTLSIIQQTIVGSTLDLLVPPVTSLLITVLESDLLDPILSLTVDPLLRLLGGLLGRAEVIINGVNIACYANITGNVYQDSNHNFILDADETGSGEVIYAKLIKESLPTQAEEVVSVNATSGSYSFSNVLQGSYKIIIALDNNTANVLPAKPTGWISTQTDDLEWSGIQLNGIDVNAINFGLYHGSLISGRSFFDNGKNGGTAHNGTKEAGEQSISGSPISLQTSGAVIIDQTITNGEGEFTLWIPNSYHNNSLTLKEGHSLSQLSVSGNTGNTGGTYTVANDHLVFNNSSGNTYSGVMLGNIMTPSFSPNGQQHGKAGTTLFFAHTFTASTYGTVRFSKILSGSEASQGNWSTVIYEDVNCDGIANAGESVIDQKTLTPDESLCLAIKIFVPTQATYGESLNLTINADFDLQGTIITHSSSVLDIAIVGDDSETGLKINKTVDKPEAFPGESITYTLTYTNNSTQAISQINIQDATPAYTTFLSATCAEIPTEITSCTISDPGVGNSGQITWEFSGDLPVGKRMLVRYSVLIQ